MTAKELIQRLQQLSPDTKIVVRGYEDGYNDISEVITRKLVPHPGRDKYYYGEYIDAEDEQASNEAVQAAELYGENTVAEF